MNAIKATLVLTALALGSLFFGCSTSTTTRTEKDSTYTISPEVIVEHDIPGLGMSLFRQPKGWAWVPAAKGDTPTSVIVFHRDKTKAKTAKEITAIFNPADSSLSITAVPLDTSATSSHTWDKTTTEPPLNFLFRPLGIAFIVILVFILLYFVLKSVAASSPTGIASTILSLFKKKN